MRRTQTVSYSLAKDTEYNVWYVLASAEGLQWVIRGYTNEQTARDDYALYVEELGQ